MKDLTVRRRHPLASKEELSIFEQEIGNPLPADYANFILRNNYIDTIENLFRAKNGNIYYVDIFYPLGLDYELSLQTVFEVLNPYFKGLYLAFANDSGGWQYVIGMSKETYGQVYFCRMDKEIPFSLTYLASTFDEFIDGLQVE